MSSVTRATLAALALAPAAVWGACSIYDQSLLVAASSDGGVEGGPAEAGVDSSDPCQHAYAPERPAADDPGGGDLEIVEALTVLDFGLDAGTADFSFDLDHTCTCPGPESCKVAAGASKHCDDSRGRDNAGRALVTKFAKLTNSFDGARLVNGLAKGSSGLLMRLRHYNGLANDTSVEVALFTSNGTLTDDAGVHVTPKHDGNDAWSSSPSSLLGGVGPPFVPNFVDINGYVRNGVLVANADFPLRIVPSANAFTLRGTTLAATLTPTGGSFSLTGGRLAGRWVARDLLTTLQVVQDPFDNTKYLCGNDVTYQDIKSQICKEADISSNLVLDPSSPCDALTVGLGFAAEPAKLAGVIADALFPTPCGATYTDQCP